MTIKKLLIATTFLTIYATEVAFLPSLLLYLAIAHMIINFISGSNQRLVECRALNPNEWSYQEVQSAVKAIRTDTHPIKLNSNKEVLISYLKLHYN